MKSKVSIVAAVAACLVLVVAGSALARGKAETKVKIKAQSGGFYGYVKSDKEKCANGREVILFKQKGNGADPKPRQGDRLGHRPGERHEVHVVDR